MSRGPPERHQTPRPRAVPQCEGRRPPRAILPPSAPTAAVSRRAVRPSIRSTARCSLWRVDTYLAVASRREVREYDGRPLPEAAVRRILEAGRVAGSSKQPPGPPLHRGDRPGALERLAGTVYNPGNLLGAALVVAVVTRGKGPGGSTRGAPHRT